MDFKVVWSPEAVEDLESITEYIERDSVFYAQAVATNILSVSRSLGNFPLVGRLVPEVDDENIQERFVYSYRLIYKIEKQRILIVAVIHGSRLLENAPHRFDL